MAVVRSSKGKTRVVGPAEDRSSSLSPLPEDHIEKPKAKKPKRAETRKCPVCDEMIPLRLLPKHAILEDEKLEAVIGMVGSTEILTDELSVEEGPGPSSRSRRSAIKAMKSMTSGNDPTNTSQQATKLIQTIHRHRKQRYAKFRELGKEEGGFGKQRHRQTAINIVCPVCSTAVSGDQDVVDAHIDSCIANEDRRLEEERQRSLERQRLEELEWEADSLLPDGAAGHIGDVRGTGFHTRNATDQDVDDELDIDGDEGFGEPQFTERDIVPVEHPHPALEDFEVDIEDETGGDAQQAQLTLWDLVAEGKILKKASKDEDGIKEKMDEVLGLGDSEKMDLAILAARKRGDNNSLITALESKIQQLEAMRVSSSTSLLCRICLDPYTEPTVSTGCWHTCCRECWLRCLGSTKLCPICKRITGASDLRRIYL